MPFFFFSPMRNLGAAITTPLLKRSCTDQLGAVRFALLIFNNLLHLHNSLGTNIYRRHSQWQSAEYVTMSSTAIMLITNLDVLVYSGGERGVAPPV